MNTKKGVGSWVAIGLLLLMGVVLSQLPSGSSELERSALSSEPNGKRALFLVLGELGFPARIWTDTPSELPRGAGLVWLPEVPEYPEGLSQLAELEGAPERAQAAIGPHDPAHYRRFMDEGGTVLLALSAAGMAEFVASELGVPIPPTGFRAASARPGASLYFTPTEEVLENSAISWFDPEYVAQLPDAELVGVLDRSAAEPALEEDAEEDGALDLPGPGTAGLVRIPVGRGSLLLLVSDRQFDNERLREADHALYATRLMERYSGGGPVLFDEYALGRWSPGSFVSVATSPSLLLASLHLLLAGLLFIWHFAWVRAFPRDAVPPEPLSALSRVRSRANLLIRAARPRQLALELRSGYLRRLRSRERLRSPQAEEDYEAEVAELLGPNAEPGELEHWLSRLVVPDAMSTERLDEFKTSLERFSERIQLRRVHASTQKGIM